MSLIYLARSTITLAILATSALAPKATNIDNTITFIIIFY
jgi:hypothetical protein